MDFIVVIVAYLLFGCSVCLLGRVVFLLWVQRTPSGQLWAYRYRDNMIRASLGIGKRNGY